MAEHDDDGGIYADGCRIMVRPKRNGRKVSMGGTLAEAHNEATATEIARRCATAPALLAAAKEALDALDRYFPNVVMDAKDSLRVAIRQAEAVTADA